LFFTHASCELSRSDSQSRRELRRSPPCVKVVAASERSHQGAPGTSAALSNHVPARLKSLSHQ